MTQLMVGEYCPAHGTALRCPSQHREGCAQSRRAPGGVTPQHGGLCADPVLQRSPIGVQSPSDLHGKGMGFPGRCHEQRAGRHLGAVPGAEFCCSHDSDVVAALPA